MSRAQVDDTVKHRPPNGRTATALIIAIAAVVSLAPRASAHVGITGGEVTEFTMPLWVVYFAGAFVVALSFALVGAFLSREKEQQELYGAAGNQDHHLAHMDTRWTPLRTLCLLLVLLIMANAIAPGASLLPAAALWLGLWVILPLIAYTLGDPWPRLSPFALLMPLMEALRGGRPPRSYPQRLGMWPAVALFLVLVAFEVGEFAWTLRSDTLAVAVTAYVLLTLLGMARYGTHWLENAEVVGRMLTWWAAVSPVRWEGRRPQWRGLSGMEQLPATRLDAVAFTLAILYGVNHDVFLHTPTGEAAIARLAAWGVPYPSIALMVAGYLLFLAAWMLASRAMRDHGESLRTVRSTAAVFAASLLPIAAAYHLAHNLPYLWQSMPMLIQATMDPLGQGWGPIGTAALTASFQVPSSWLKAIAGTQILLIIFGHLVAVLTAHRIAFRAHPSRVQAVRAEIPLTLAMVLYTGIGLALLGAKGGGVA